MACYGRLQLGEVLGGGGGSEGEGFYCLLVLDGGYPQLVQLVLGSL